MQVPPLPEILASARVVALPLVERFRGLDVREAVVFEGPAGWTEFSPFAEYPDAEAAVWLRAALDFGWHEPPPARRDRIRVNATVPAVPAASVAEVLARFDGCRTAKVKVGPSTASGTGGTGSATGRAGSGTGAAGSATTAPVTRAGLVEDVDRVRAVRVALGPEGRIRLDANGSWTLDEAERAIHLMSPFDIEYVEQPCATVAELAELHRRIRYLDIPIAADESVRRADDPLAVARAGAADLLVVKAAPLGGIRPALDIVAAAGLPAVVSSALDTSIGLAMGAALAAALPDLDHDCGLGTAALLAADVTARPLLPQDGTVDVRRVAADPDLLVAHAADDTRTAWWLDRLARCHALLERGVSAAGR